MAYGIVLEFEGVGKKEYDAVNALLGIDPVGGTGDWPKGLTSHAGGTTADGGLCVFEVWESKAEQEANRPRETRHRREAIRGMNISKYRKVTP